jgi:L-gulonolactone oxidase|tara:strand:+ start:20991 stop:22295 length:1305 start_codon:yes stop_codon:yes gene_type:complete
LLLTDKWLNWAGNQTSYPHSVLRPDNENAISEIVGLGVAKRLKVRPIGNGHSFSSIGSTDGFLVSLQDLNSILDIDKEKLQVTVGAGIILSDLNAQLHKLGLALPNLGDIDSQSIAGAIATGTHGTGITFNSISSAVVGIRIVTGDGSIVDISESENAEFFEASKVSLGALGIVVSVTLQCVRSFNLELTEFTARLPEIISRFEHAELSSDFVEFFWFPYTDIAEIKICNKTNSFPSRVKTVSKFVNDEIIRNLGFDLLNRFWLRFPGTVNRSMQLLTKEGDRPTRVDISHKIFCSKRRVKFIEMEYAVPREQLFDAFEAVRHITEGLRIPVTFPVEIRTLGADHIPLSMANGRDTGFIAIHLYNHAKSRAFFHEVEKAMRQFAGRPHWGKIHNLDSSDLVKLYPQWNEFTEARQALDPDGHFTNSYLERVLGY